MNKIELAANLLDAGTSPASIKKVLQLDEPAIKKAHTLRKVITIELFRRILTRAKETFSLLPGYEISFEYTTPDNDEIEVTSNQSEMLDYVKRHAGGEFQPNGKLRINLQ
jgi:hypothetical protein